MYREEQSLKLGLPLIEALENIRRPYKSLQEQIDRLNANIEHFAKRLDSLKV
jgi:prefoldin subunit 5